MRGTRKPLAHWPHVRLMTWCRMQGTARTDRIIFWCADSPLATICWCNDATLDTSAGVCIGKIGFLSCRLQWKATILIFRALSWHCSSFDALLVCLLWIRCWRWTNLRTSLLFWECSGAFVSTHAARQTYPWSLVIDPSSTALRNYLTNCLMVSTTNGNVKSMPHGVSNCICYFKSIDVLNVQQSFIEQL